MLQLAPITLTEARAYVARHHRHNRAPVGGLFAVSAIDDSGAVVGIAIAGRPVARNLQDGFTAEVTRVTTEGHRNAGSMLLAACRRAAHAMGYRRVLTYTLESEPGTVCQAAGFIRDGEVQAAASWSRPSRHRVDADLFGNQTRPTEAKVRWIWKVENGGF